MGTGAWGALWVDFAGPDELEMRGELGSRDAVFF